MNHNLDFLFLSEADAVKAGAGDIHTCIQVMDEVFDLLGQGDYLMGAPNHNSHGIKIYFPKETPFPGMPVKGPDRRFMALVGYLGGRFHVCGEKWYGSNLANREKGLPRSILTTVLNDPDTGAPLAIMLANALSTARTGAIPAVGAKYFARNQAETVSAIGIGVIGRACLEALMDVLKSIREIRLCDIDEAAAKRYAEELREKYKVSVKVAASVEEAVRGSDVVNVATSGSVSPRIEDEWLKEGALLTLPASADISETLMMDSRIVVDNWEMYEAYAEELRNAKGGFGKNLSGICGFMMDLVWDGKIRKEDITGLGDVAAGKAEGRHDDKEKVIFIMDGMPIEDLAWGYTIYRNALEQGIGKRLNLWGDLT